MQKDRVKETVTVNSKSGVPREVRLQQKELQGVNMCAFFNPLRTAKKLQNSGRISTLDNI
jgi:hypothetical protein